MHYIRGAISEGLYHGDAISSIEAVSQTPPITNAIAQIAMICIRSYMAAWAELKYIYHYSQI